MRKISAAGFSAPTSEEMTMGSKNCDRPWESSRPRALESQLLITPSPMPRRCSSLNTSRTPGKGTQ